MKKLSSLLLLACMFFAVACSPNSESEEAEITLEESIEILDSSSDLLDQVGAEEYSDALDQASSMLESSKSALESLESSEGIEDLQAAQESALEALDQANDLMNSFGF